MILEGLNRDEVLSLTRFAIDKNIHIAFIEEMPLGQVNVGGKALAYVSSDELKAELEQHFELQALNSQANAGPRGTFSLREPALRSGSSHHTATTSAPNVIDYALAPRAVY